jgi:hypothetical protein
MNILELLVGKKMMVMTDMKVEVELTIKEVKENSHSIQIGESNAQNDWWPETRDWKDYTVFFTNGAHKTFDTLSQIKVVEEKKGNYGSFLQA